MLEAQQLLDWRRKLALNERTERLIQQVRSSEPARRVAGRRGNVTGFFPSRKMGHTVQYASLSNELSAIYLMEYHEDDLLEYWDQPPSFTLRYKTKAGINHGHLHTPDFFVHRRERRRLGGMEAGRRIAAAGREDACAVSTQCIWPMALSAR